MLHAKPTDFQELPPNEQIEIHRNTLAEESVEVIQASAKQMSASDKTDVNANNKKPEIGQYWECSSDTASLYAVVLQLFVPTTNA